jgi:hypothetical protein
MTRYARLTARFPAADGGTTRRTVWVRVAPPGVRTRRYWVVDREGTDAEPRELLIVDPADIVRERPARMNLTYAELELES